MREPTLYILCGLPFSGKTTLARQLADKLHLYHIEVDAIKRERGIGLEGQRTSESEWEAIFAEADRRLIATLERGRTVLYDATNYARDVRDHLRTLAVQHGAFSAIIYVPADAAAADRRRQANRTTSQRGQVRDEEFNDVVTGFQEPTEDENVLRYDPSVPLADWISRTFR